MSTQKTETQTETNTKSDAKTAMPSFDPTAAWAAGQQAFTKMITEAFERMQAMQAEMATLEAQMIAKAREAVTNWAQLAQEAITYSANLSAQARKVGADAARKMGVA
jgi:hypothetical protein